MNIATCSCCKSKKITFLFCCAKMNHSQPFYVELTIPVVEGEEKKFSCRECYQDVCSDCLSSSETCHTCYVRGRPDANSVEVLNELDSDELERLMKTLHLDPSKKSDKEWINMIAQHCGLPMKAKLNEEDYSKHNGHQLLSVNGKEDLPSPVVTVPVIRATLVKNKKIAEDGGVLCYADHVLNQLADRQHNSNDSSDDGSDEGTESDDNLKHKNRQSSDHEETSLGHEDESVKISEREYEDSVRIPELSQRYTTEMGTKSFSEYSRQKRSFHPANEETEMTEIDLKILRNIQQSRKLTAEEQQSVENFETKIRTWKSKANQVPPRKTMYEVSKNEISKLKYSKEVNDEAPITSNIRAIISQMDRQRNSVVIENGLAVIEIKNITKNREASISIEPLPPPIHLIETKKRESFRTSTAFQNETKKPVPIVILDKIKTQTMPIEQIPDVHRSADRRKVLDVKRNSVQASKHLTDKIVEIVNKSKKLDTEKNTPKEVLNEASIDYLLSSIFSEKAIEQMNVMQMRKHLRQLDVENGSQLLFKREELVAELSQWWCQASKIRKANDLTSAKEFTIVMPNQPQKVLSQKVSASITTGNALCAVVRVVSLHTIANQEQIHKLNIFQLKSLLQDEGNEVNGISNREQLVDIAVQRWKTLKSL